jgi:putative ABC transport system permease protein
MRGVIAYRMLWYDRVATAGSILGVVAILFLVGQQLSTMFGLFTFMSVLVDHSGADMWVVSKETKNANAVGPLPERYVDRLIGLAEVEWAEPIIMTAGQTRRPDGKYEGVMIVGLPAPRLQGGPWAFTQGNLADLLDYEGVTVDSGDLDLFGNPQVGDILEINRTRVRVAGITHKAQGFGGTLVFTNRTRARDIADLPADTCSYILVKLRPDADPRAALARMREVVPRADVIPTGRLSATTRAFYIVNTGIGGSFGTTTLISSLVGIVIVMLTMYTSVLSREKDFAVLRALGGRKRDLFVIVLYQGLMIAAAGIFVGFFLFALFLYGTRDTALPTYVPPWFPFVHAAFTLVLCLAGSSVAIRRATRVEPATAFR